MVGLNYLKQSFNESDESVLDRFLENPYWQYFCGFEQFQHHLPIDSSSLTRFRKRLGSSGFEKLFEQVLDTIKRGGHLRKSHLNKVNIDTTVQEKAIAFPTDARLYYIMREALVRVAKARDIELRQNYKRVAKRALPKQGRYSHAKQMKRSQRENKRLRTMLGRVYRDILRKNNAPVDELTELLRCAKQFLTQQREDKNKLYSAHSPEVECISKGKVHKRYEFGCKVGVVTTSRDKWIVGVTAFHDNPYDGPFGNLGTVGLNATFLSMDPVERTTEFYPDGTGEYVDAGCSSFGFDYSYIDFGVFNAIHMFGVSLGL